MGFIHVGVQLSAGHPDCASSLRDTGGCYTPAWHWVKLSDSHRFCLSFEKLGVETLE